MAAFGGVCLENTRDARNKLVSIIPYRFLPDELLALEDIFQFLNPFLSDLNKILTIQDVATRDIARDALGAELHPRLYSKVIKHLDECVLGLNYGRVVGANYWVFHRTTRAYEHEGYSPSEEYLLFLDQVDLASFVLVTGSLTVFASSLQFSS